jgi:hypothetical protein
VVLLRKRFPQNNELQTAAELGVEAVEKPRKSITFG